MLRTTRKGRKAQEWFQAHSILNFKEAVMRMWMVDPSKMCRKHLLGEHVELHMFVGTLIKGISIDGYIKNDLLEPFRIITRHYDLMLEMTDRGYNHDSFILHDKEHEEAFRKAFNHLPLRQRNHKINKENSLRILMERCPECRKNFSK